MEELSYFEIETKFLTIPRTLFLKICEVAEVSRGTQVPCLEFKVFTLADCPQIHHRVTPINFFVFESESQNDVVDRFIDNHIFPDCQEKSPDLKVAQPVDQKIDFHPNPIKYFPLKNRASFFLLGFATRGVRGLQLRSNF